MSLGMAHAAPLTLADRLFPAKSIGRDVSLVAGGALLTALSAQVLIPLPFTPVPITLQTFAVLLLGAGLGSKRGLFSQMLYLLVGAVGLPVYAGQTAGLATLFGPTMGYFFGFMVAAYLTGRLAEKQWDRSPKAVGAMILGELAIYACGLAGLGLAVGYGPKLFVLGLFPFLIGDALKLLAASGLLPLVWRIAGPLPKQ